MKVDYMYFPNNLHERFNLEEGEHVLIRGSFRWKMDGDVISNGYESCSIEGLLNPDNYLATGGMEITQAISNDIYIVRKRK